MKRYALVTGASGGIGEEISRKLAGEGWNLYLQYYKGKEKVERLQRELEGMGAEVISIQADLASAEGARFLASQLFTLEAVVFAGGTAHYSLFQEIEEAEMDKLWQLHVKSPMILVQLTIPKLRKAMSPSIVFVSSVWGQTGAACEVAYSTVKGAQIAFVKALAKELAPSNIRVNAVAPGAVNTPMMDQFSLEEKAEIAGEIPMGRLGAAAEVAEAVYFVCSSASSYITGHVLAVNGGWYT
ncbi:3-ketoacyl-ACP reductase [Bacillus sp. FJAT-27231]|uniref:elongation factor P 5-aminopentanone reductase n=1 Tax=Bacillus sp. FJAT-27231 TaxID=1679168 RepID=UPI00067100E1|nr:SDR family oxidoreductase [Bacillus sp. FJAT-27231]KMY53676.1 3-ketoacyl-ACP reductase [Bacillus sp. FJAT-27231]